MFGTHHLIVFVIGLPLLALIIELVGGTHFSERHHIHHDTYGVSPVVPRTLTLVMVFMGVLGSLVGWLCHIGVFAATDPELPLAFFVAFQVTLLLMVMAVVRYRVMAYSDHMVVWPAFIRRRTIYYDRIERMEWRSSYLGPHLHDLYVWTSDGQRARIWCLLDIEQVMLRIDRLDTLQD